MATEEDQPFASSTSLLKDLVTGTPNKTQSFSKVLQGETPVWMQQAIYDQTQLAKNFAQTPYQPYMMPTLARLTDEQKQAYSNISNNVANAAENKSASWQPDIWNAQSGMFDQTTNETGQTLQTDQSAYLRSDLGDKNLDTGQATWDTAGGLSPLTAASTALNKSLGLSAANAGSGYLSRAADVDIGNAGDTRFNQAANADLTGAYNGYFDAAGRELSTSSQERALEAADPYMKAASASGAGGVQGYMNPYQTGVMDAMAQQSARNLKENILPGVSDAFIKAGNFGSARMGEFGNRAVRDTQQSLLQQQAALLNQGYDKAVTASQADLARQAQLAGIAGNTAGADLSRITQNAGVYNQQGQTAATAAAQQGQLYLNLGQSEIDRAAKQASMYGQLGQTAGNLTAQDMQNYANIGQTQGQLTNAQQQNLINLGQQQAAAGQAQQTLGLNAAGNVQTATAQDYQRQMGALGNYAGLISGEQQMLATDNAALEAAGAAQQKDLQADYDVSKQQFYAPLEYARSNIDFLNTQIKGLAPITPMSNTTIGSGTGQTYSPSPLSTIGSGYNIYKGMTTPTTGTTG
jgi:hypothetical protein